MEPDDVGGGGPVRLSEQGWTNAATIIDTSTEYTQSLGDYFVETFKHLGGNVVSEDTYTMGDMQINAQIQRLQDLPEPPDVIFLSTNMPDYAMMVRELRAAGFEQPLMGGDAMDTADFYPAVGADLGNNIFISTHSFLGAEVSPEMAEFLDLYEAEVRQGAGDRLRGDGLGHGQRHRPGHRAGRHDRRAPRWPRRWRS